jgi:hypothetical protein
MWPQPKTCTSHDQPTTHAHTGRTCIGPDPCLRLRPRYMGKLRLIYPLLHTSLLLEGCCKPVSSTEKLVTSPHLEILFRATSAQRETSVMSPTVRARATARPATTWAQHATRGSLKTSTGLYHGLSPLRRWAVCSRIQSPPPHLPSPQAAPSAPAFPERPTSAPQPSAPHDRTQPAFPGCLMHAHCPLAPPPHPNTTQKQSEAISIPTIVVPKAHGCLSLSHSLSLSYGPTWSPSWQAGHLPGASKRC